jgi:hypothetical protein
MTKMVITELFKINMDLVPYSHPSVVSHILSYKTKSWKIFSKTDKFTLIESAPDILGRIYYIPFVSSLEPTMSEFVSIVGENMEPAGYVEFHRNRILSSSDSRKTYVCKTEVFTPHIRLSNKLRGTGLAVQLYKYYIDNGKSLVTTNHTAAAVSLWNKIGFATFKLPQKSQTKLQPCELDDSATVYKCILGKGRAISTL